MSLITRELWHGIHNALPRHPLLWYPLRYQEAASNRHGFWIEFIPTVMVMAASLISILLWVILGVSPIILVLLLDTYAGMLVARGVCTTILRARGRGLLDLTSVAPSGQMGAIWALMTRYLRRDQTLKGVHQAAAWLHAVWLFALLPFGGLVLLTFCGSSSMQQTEFAAIFNQPMMLFNGFLILAVMILDYISALVGGALIGLLVATVTDLRTESTITTSVVYIGFQVGQYATLLLLQLVLNVALSVPGLLSGWTSSLTFVAAFVIVREGALWGLCVILARRTNSTVHDVLNIHRRSL